MPDRLEITYHIDSKVNLNFDMKKAMRRAGRYMVSSTQRKISKNSFTPIAPLTQELRSGSKGRPLRDTGALISSITFRVNGESVIIGTNRIGARINNFGGTITAKNKSGCLWIPASREVKLALQNQGGSISRLLRMYKNGGYSLFRAGNAFFVRKKGKGNEKIMLFILKKSIKIPARNFFYISDDDDKVLRRILHVIERNDGSGETDPEG